MTNTTSMPYAGLEAGTSEPKGKYAIIRPPRLMGYNFSCAANDMSVIAG